MITPERIAEIRESAHVIIENKLATTVPKKVIADLLEALDAMTKERDAALKSRKDIIFQFDSLRKWCADNDIIPACVWLK